MTPSAPTTRFAPSPTGQMHLGNARTALFNALLAAHEGGRFLLRIEDTDRDRSEPRFEAGVLDDLRWLKIAWDGDGEVVRQSDRHDLYDQLFTRLQLEGHAYHCFCSEETLTRQRSEQLSAGQPPRYPGTCRGLAAEEVAARQAQGEVASLRFRLPEGEAVGFEDLVRGPQSFTTDDLGDFVIRRSDGTAAFLFSNAVDDSLMGVTHVLRGEDHLSNTPRQLLVQRALELSAPRYGHLPLIVGEDGTPLSKRHGSHSVHDLREAGYLPEAVVNYLARLGHHLEAPELLGSEAMGEAFQLTALGHAPARFDVDQLRHWQRAAVTAAPADCLWEWMGEQVQTLVPEVQATAFVEAVRPNVLFPEQAHFWSLILFRDPLPMNPEAARELAESAPDFFRSALQVWEQATPENFAVALRKATGAKGRALFHPLRLALTGEPDGPELRLLLPLLGHERVRTRLARAVELAGGTPI